MIPVASRMRRPSNPCPRHLFATAQARASWGCFPRDVEPHHIGNNLTPEDFTDIRELARCSFDYTSRLLKFCQADSALQDTSLAKLLVLLSCHC